MFTRIMRSSLSCLLFTVPLLACCSCAQTRRYNVQVLNGTDGPITVGLGKEGGPYEPHLGSPEELAVGTPASDENLWPSEVVAPGRIGYTRVEGKFGGKSELALRIYGGKPSLSEILSIGRGSAERFETILLPEPAMNKLVVTRGADHHLQAEMVDRFPQTQQAPTGK